MQVLLKTKIGSFLVVSSVLAVWTLLAAQSVQAHSVTNPSCSGLPTVANFFTDAETADLSLSGGALAGHAPAPTPKKGTGASGEGSQNFYYAKITVPALTAGELMVSDATPIDNNYSSEAILCGRQEGSVSSQPSYASAHTTADNAADAALRAQTAAAAAPTTPGSAATNAENAARSALNTAANALASYSGTTLTGGIAHALRRAAAAASGTVADTLNGAADTAITRSNAARVASGRDAIALAPDTGTATDGDATAEAGVLTTAAADLRTAAHALSAHMAFSINAVISSGDEEYVVVMSVPTSATATPTLTIGFEGVMSTDAEAPAGGSFTQNNQRDPHTLRATNPGLLTVRTTGNEVDTKGTLNDATADIAMDEPSGGNFEIVSPMDNDADYVVAVEGQTRGERGDYGLKMEFGVAEELVTGDYADTTLGDETDGSEDTRVTLVRGRADYFFFTTASADAGNLFLTVETQKHMDVTTETNTTGAFYGQAGQIATDTDNGTGNNFLLRAPIASGKDYIIEVTGSSSSTEGKYVLKTTSTPAPSRGSAPDAIMVSATDSIITNAGEVDPHSITVTKAGTLQVKTTGDTDTVGVLYGPDGRQIATDDNSADGMRNFLITEYVEAGQYIVTVEGQSRSTTNAAYVLVVNFVEGADIDVGTRPPGTGTETEEQLRDQIADLQDDLDACRMPVETDARGALDNPSDGSFRSGIGIISGWVCAAQEVEVEIRRAPGVLVETLTVAHGTSRPDVPENSSCTNANAGFGMTYNFNHLREGDYTIQAYADGEEIGAERSFEVVHLEEFATNDTDRFLRLDEDVQDRGVCIVSDFPATGERTWLRWEESTQNFVIEDAG